MGLQITVNRVFANLARVMPELKNRTGFGYTEIPKTKSPPWIVGLPGGGMRDKLVGAPNQDRDPRSIRNRHAAATFVIYGVDYTYIEGTLHELIAAIEFSEYGRCTITDPYYVPKDQDALSAYGETYRLPVFFHYPVAKSLLSNETSATITGVGAERSDPNTLPSNLGS